MTSPVWIIDALRTPRAKKRGAFAQLHPVDLLTYPLNAITSRHKLEPCEIQDVIAGCVTQVGEQSWCIARAAVLAAGWPIHVPGATVNRLCGSGLQAVHFVAAQIAADNYDLAIAGGVEHMTRVPMFSDSGGEYSQLLKKHHPDLVSQGLAAEILALRWGFSREDLDQYALRSQKNAATALLEKRFKDSVIEVSYFDNAGKQHSLLADDNVRADTSLAALAALKPAFKGDGVITAGNASAIVDGAAAILLASDSAVKKFSLKPRARIIAQAVVGSDPVVMLSGPITASQAVLKKAGLKKDQIDIFEINEAFAPVPLATAKDLDIPLEKVNVNGGGISLGHPLGATGAMLVGQALDELSRIKKRYALITMCIGLGMGIATIIERVE